MVPYVGSGDYCYSYSLSMCLLGSGANPDSLPSPGFLECLTTMPFGNTYIKGAELFLFGAPDPDEGLTCAIQTLGWTCQVERGGGAHEARERLRAALQHGPALIGPLDLGYLTYNPHAPFLRGADHFLVVLALEDEQVLVHDPKGFPCATLPMDTLLAAWRAERIPYLKEPYSLRGSFRLVEAVSRQQMIQRTLPSIRANLQHDPWVPQVVSGSVPALHLFIQALRKPIPEQLAGFLLSFALPLGVRRKLDAQAFLREGNQLEAAALIEQQARLLGQAQFPGAQREWSSVASLIEQVALLEERLLALCAFW